jgi:predicted RNase H-like HicB family nuclease
MLMIELEREGDGRWIGEVLELSGCMAYGANRDEAERNTKALAFRVIADRLEHGEYVPINSADYFIAA